MSNSHARTTKQAMDLAKMDGLVAIFPTDRELTLDFDIPYTEAMIRHSAMVNSGKTSRTLRDLKTIMFLSQLWTTSKSGNAHLYIYLNMPLDGVTRSFYQALLGSDTTRELFNYTRLGENKGKEDRYEMCLFEKPDQADIVNTWRWKCRLEGAIYRINKVRYGHNTPELRNAMDRCKKKLGL